jgi:hypothetical protein
VISGMMRNKMGLLTVGFQEASGIKKSRRVVVAWLGREAPGSRVFICDHVDFMRIIKHIYFGAQMRCIDRLVNCINL